METNLDQVSAQNFPNYVWMSAFCCKADSVHVLTSFRRDQFDVCIKHGTEAPGTGRLAKADKYGKYCALEYRTNFKDMAT
jgi:hypothetical protein